MRIDKDMNKRYNHKDGTSISDLDFKLLTLNGFLNGYNDKLSLCTVPNSTKFNAKEIKIDSFEYLKAKESTDMDSYYLDIKKQQKDKLKNVKHKVNDYLTQKDILAAYKKNINN